MILQTLQRLAIPSLFGLIAAAGCGSDDRASVTPGTAETGQSGVAGESEGGAGGGVNETKRQVCEAPAGQGGDPGLPTTCLVGEQFCQVDVVYGLDEAGSGNATRYQDYTPACRDFSPELEYCAKTPTCDCLCTWFNCGGQCRCDDASGFARIVCEQI